MDVCISKSVFAGLQATEVNPEQLLVTVLPGLPTAAEFFLLPDKQLTDGKPDKTATHLDQVHYAWFSISVVKHSAIIHVLLHLCHLFRRKGSDIHIMFSVLLSNTKGWWAKEASWQDFLMVSSRCQCWAI